MKNNRWCAALALVLGCSDDPMAVRDPSGTGGTGGEPSTTGTGAGGTGAEGGGGDSTGGESMGGATTGTGAGGNGGDGGAMQGLGYENGTRLRARVLTAGDGSKEFIGWFDTIESTPCSYERAADAMTRCLPEAPPPPNEASYFFADAGCTQRVLGVNTAAMCAPFQPDYARIVVSQASCLTVTHVHAVTGPHVGPVFESPVNAPGCSLYPGGNVAFFDLGPEISPATYQLADVLIE